MTDTAFRRLVKRQGGCGLVVTEMVSSEGLVRGIDRTLEYAEYTEEERPGLDSDLRRRSRGDGRRGADRRRHGRRHRRRQHGLPGAEDREAQRRLQPDARARARGAASFARWRAAVRIPVTVKMRAGWNEQEINAPELARMVEDAGAAAVAVHGRTAAQSYIGRVRLVAHRARRRGRDDSRVRIGRLRRAGAGRLAAADGRRRRRARRPRRAAQSVDLRAGRPTRRGPRADASSRSRSAASSCSTTSTCCSAKRVDEARRLPPRRAGPGRPRTPPPPRAAASAGSSTSSARSASWYTKGLDGGSHLRVAINSRRVDRRSCATSSKTSSSRRSASVTGALRARTGLACASKTRPRAPVPLTPRRILQNPESRSTRTISRTARSAPHAPGGPDTGAVRRDPRTR